MAYVVWTRRAIDENAVSSAAFIHATTIEFPYDAAEMAIFLMNGTQNDVYVECLETGAIFAAPDMHILKDPWINQRF